MTDFRGIALRAMAFSQDKGVELHGITNISPTLSIKPLI